MCTAGSHMYENDMLAAEYIALDLMSIKYLVVAKVSSFQINDYT